MCAGGLRWPEQLDVVDVPTAFARDAFALQSFTHAPSEIGERFGTRQVQHLPVVLHQVKPVATPSDIASDRAMTRYIHRDALGVPPSRNVAHGHFARGQKLGGYYANRRFNAVFTGRQFAKPSQRGDEPDGAVATHVQVADIVEEDDASSASGVRGWREQGAYHHVAPARFVHYRRAKVVVLLAELRHTFGQRAGQFGSPFQYEPRGLAASMGIDNTDALHAGLP